MTDLVARPWSNGTEWLIWESNNCDRCVKQATCDLPSSAWLEGGLTAETAARMGWQDEYQETGRWFCAERELPDAPPKPAALVMAEAGAQQLPGMEAVS
jgi:hypothetical protein